MSTNKLLILSVFLILTGNSKAKIGIGDPAPDFTLEDVKTGEDVSLSSFRGQIVVLRIWRVCRKCRTYVPVLNKIQNEFSLKSAVEKPPLKVLSVNAIDYEKRIRSEIHKTGDKYQVLIGRNSGITRDYQTITLPRIYVIDKNGVIRYIATYPEYEELKEVILKLINESAEE